MKTLIVPKFRVERTENPDIVNVYEYSEAPEDWYQVIQLGIWRWKRFAVAYLVMGAAAGGINSDHWHVCSEFFATREEARQAAYTGKFKLIGD